MRFVTLQVHVSDAFLSDVLCTALEGGIGYWAEAEGIGLHNAQYLNAVLVDADGDDDWRHTVDYDAIVRGIQAVLAPEFRVDSAIKQDIHTAVAQGDAGMIDINAADVIVQAACFGEIIYG